MRDIIDARNRCCFNHTNTELDRFIINSLCLYFNDGDVSYNIIYPLLRDLHIEYNISSVHSYQSGYDVEMMRTIYEVHIYGFR